MKRVSITTSFLLILRTSCVKKPTTTVVSTSTTSTSSSTSSNLDFYNGYVNISVRLKSASNPKIKGAIVNFSSSLDSLQKKKYWRM